MKFLVPLAQLVLLMGLGIARADLTANDPAPPLAQSQTLTVYRGESAPIPLRAQGRLANESRFLLRTPPQFGTLSEIKPNRPGSATVWYRHDDQNGTGTDSFTYAAQAPGSPVSAPARIRIRVIERPAVFLTPEQLDFGVVMTSEHGEQKLTLENQGGSRVQGTLQIPPPWKVVGDGRYDLGRGKSDTYTLQFFPNDETDYVGKIRFSHDAKAETRLHGRGQLPFRVSPLMVELSPPQKSPPDSPSHLTISNPQPRPLNLKIEAPPFLEVPASLEVPAEGQSELLLKVKANAITGGEGKIRVIHDQESREIAVRVFPAPAEIVTEPAKNFHFGSVALGETLPGYFRMINRGGTTTEIQIHPPRAIILAQSLNITLAPGQTQEVHFRFEPDKTGDFAESLTLNYQKQTYELKFTARVTDPHGGTTPPRTQISPEAMPELSPQEPAPPVIPYSFEKLYVAAQTYHTIKIAWPKPATQAPAAYRIDRRIITRDDQGKPRELWEPLSGVIYAEEGNAITAEIRGLFANQGFSVRVLSLDPAGNFLAASPKFSIATRTYSPPTISRWLWGTPALGLLVVFLWLARRRRRQVQNQDFDRIEKITRN